MEAATTPLAKKTNSLPPVAWAVGGDGVVDGQACDQDVDQSGPGAGLNIDGSDGDLKEAAVIEEKAGGLAREAAEAGARRGGLGELAVGRTEGNVAEGGDDGGREGR